MPLAVSPSMTRPPHTGFRIKAWALNYALFSSDPCLPCSVRSISTCRRGFASRSLRRWWTLMDWFCEIVWVSLPIDVAPRSTPFSRLPRLCAKARCTTVQVVAPLRPCVVPSSLLSVAFPAHFLCCASPSTQVAPVMAAFVQQESAFGQNLCFSVVSMFDQMCSCICWVRSSLSSLLCARFEACTSCVGEFQMCVGVQQHVLGFNILGGVQHFWVCFNISGCVQHFGRSPPQDRNLWAAWARTK